MNALVSSWFNQFHHRFTTVSPVGTSLNSATWDRVLRYNNVRQTSSILYSVSNLVTLCCCYHINYLHADRPISPWASKPIFQLYGRILTIRDPLSYCYDKCLNAQHYVCSFFLTCNKRGFTESSLAIARVLSTMLLLRTKEDIVDLKIQFISLQLLCKMI